MGDLHKVKTNEAIPINMTSTLFIPPTGYVAVRNIGIVKGISVRTRNICYDIAIGCNALLGGSNYLLVGLYHDTRQEAYNRMVDEAVTMGANCVIGVSYESTEIGVLCYGTALQVETEK